jgi:hypothetical protein
MLAEQMQEDIAIPALAPKSYQVGASAKTSRLSERRNLNKASFDKDSSEKGIGSKGPSSSVIMSYSPERLPSNRETS